MTLASAVNPKSVHPANPRQQEGNLTSVGELEFEEARPHRPGRVRRVGVIALGAILVAAACAIVGLAFVQGSWWYSCMTDRALDHASRARAEAIRDAVDASGAAPEAVVWLDRALDPHVDPTTVRAYLITAREAMKAADDPRLIEAAQDLQVIIQTIRPSASRMRPSDFTETTAPHPVPTLEWPW